MAVKFVERFQTVGQKHVSRGEHVWKDHGKGLWKCVLCGGVAKNPTRNELPDRFEEVTAEERALCPNPITMG